MPIDLEFEKNGDFYSIVTVFPRGGKIKGTLIFDESATSSTATANGELLPDANNKGGVVSGSAAKDNVPMDSIISQNTSETKPEDDKSTQAVPAETEHFTAGTFTHTKTGQKIPRAKIKGKTDKYKAILAVAKKHGGIYSKFAKCFLFDSEAERDDFVREAEKSVFNTDINETTENNATDNQQEGDKVPSGEDTATTVEQDNQEAGISTSEGTNATVEQNNSEADTVVSEGATATADENSQEDNAGTNEQVDGSASITTGSSENEKEKTKPAYSEVAENAEATEAMAKTENDQQENLEEGQKATQQEDKNISTSAEKSAPEVNTYNGFTESLSSKQQARIAKTLSVKVKDADGKRNITRAEYVEKAVADDRPIHEVETDKGTEYRIYTGNDDNSYVKVTKTEYDYAKFLGAKPLTDKVTAKTEVMSGENYKDKEADDSKDKAESKTDNQAEDNNKAEKTEGKEKNSKESSDKSKEKIEDFGEYLYGARKDYYGMYAEKLRASDKLDLNKVPLSKFWPEPNYNKLLESGADKEIVAFIRALRDMVAESMPSKRSWRYDQWASMAKRLNKDAKSALEWGMMPQDFIFLGSFADAIKLKMQMYKELGHDVSLKDIHIDKIDNGMLTHNGNEYRGTKDKPIYMVRGKARRNFWNSWPYLTIPKNSVEEAIAEYKKVLDKQKAQEPTQRIKLTFKDKVEVGRIRGEKTYMLYVTFGSKSNWTTLAEGFESVSEARKYLDDHADELEKIYNAMKAAPPTRRSTNSPRVGTDYRNGQDVTPEMFTEAFGFRGVQFGNWVEGDRRQQDINQAYDALMDLAGVIQVSPRALSLGGELGLAFGARGKGGKDAAAAHYEPGAVVINLTKRSGAGSLAHEWFHAVDHYLAWSHDDMGLMTDGMSKKNRQEVIKAFEALRKTFKETGLYKRSKLMDETRKNPYYTMNTEMGARSFESYVKNKLKQQNQRNDYLANISSQKAFDNSEPWWDTKFKDKLEETGGTRYPYPLESELGTFEKAFDHLFDVLEEKVEDRKTILYSVSDESAEQMSVNDFIDAIHSEFPYAKNVQQDGNLVSLEMPGGQKLHISLVDKIAFTAEDKAAAEKAYGRELSAAETPQGKYEGVGQDGFITLTKDNKKGTISHEAYHFAKQFLDDKAKVVLEKRYKNEEAEAEAFRKWRNARNRSGMLSKIWQKIQDTASSMADLLGLETEHAVFRSIESGDVFKNNAADGKLAKDSANWRKALKEAWNTPTDTVKSGDTLKVMDTPLVLQLIGAKYLPMNIRRSKIEAIKNKHPEMTQDVLSELPNNLADPMFIFKSTSYPGRYIIALELKDKSGVNVVVPVIFDEKDGRVEINRIATAYGKDGGKKAKTNYKWFTDNIENGNTVYINKEKVTDFYQSAGLQLPLEGRRFSDLFGDSIKTEEDLVKLKNENPAKYSIGEQSENNNPDKEDIRFSVSNDTGTKENVSAMTEEQMINEVKQAFPTAKNINADGSSVTFTLPNGHKVTVNYVKRIGLTEAEKRQAAADYGREITDNDVIEGRYHGLGQEAFIEIAEGGREGTINHEAFHYAMEAALTQKMKDFLNKKYNNSEEAMAEAFRQWCNDRAHSDKLGKIWNKVKDFASSIANLLGIQTKQGIFKDIASGKAFEGMTYDISNTKYALTYNAKVTLFKRIAEHVDAAIKDMQNAGKTDEYIKDQLKGYPNFRESFMQKLHSNYETNVVKDLEGRRLIVERIARHRGIRPGDLDYDEVVKESKELISRAEEYFTQICEDRASNVGFSAGIVTPNDATRIRNGILGSRQVNRRGEKALHSVTTKATTGNGGGSSYAKFSINTNDNSKPGFVQRIRNLFKGEKKNSTEYRRMVQNIMEDLSQCKIRWGKMDEGLASIYKEAQKVIRVAKPYDWANALPNVGYAVAKRLGIEDSATPETSKIANYIADWVMTGAPNNTSQEAKDFAEAMKNNPYMADKLLELQNIFMQYSDKSTHDFHQNVVSFERPREKDYFHNFAMKLYDQFIEELGPVQRMVEGIEKVKKEKIPKNLNPYVA
ncbi:MAG: LPD5 domain-containing protein, partial [Selenomonadaceae bacterium]|nr:LPD5 domain-containing protein [Selenomonadaceae bacterium]